jgi:hypothetical protein
MAQKLERFYRELNMQVVRLTPSEKKAAESRFNALVAEADREGRFQDPGAFQLHQSLYITAHFGADASSEVPEGTELEPLPGDP